MINFRDMGGIETIDGRHIKSGMLFRTAIINPKNKKELKYLLSLKLDYIIDLRNPYEAVKHPDYIPMNCQYISAPVLITYENSGVVPKSIKKYVTTATKQEILSATQEFADTYDFMPYSVEAYSKLFEKLREGKRIAFHCTAGKDRTGIAAMIIQLALGCSQKSAIDEFLKTDVFRKKYNDKYNFIIKLLTRKQYLRDYFVMCAYAHESFIVHALKAIFDKYATIEDFLATEYSIPFEDVEKWKELYLE